MMLMIELQNEDTYMYN